MTLVVAGLAMTAVMQSSTASIAVTISAFYAGAVGLEQAAALIVGQNIGTATSSALAAIGASATAKRLALAYVLFKLIAALIALAAFPLTAALMGRLAAWVDGTTLLAAYHTAYNVVGVAVLLPATQWFTRFVERLLPSKDSALRRALDPAALVNSVVAVEAARRALAEVLKTVAASVVASLSGGAGRAEPGVSTAGAALGEVRSFLSELKEPPETEAEQRRMTSTLHALDHMSRLAETLEDGGMPGPSVGGPDDLRAAELCKQVMRWTQTVGESITGESALSERAAADRMERVRGSERRARRGRKRCQSARRRAARASRRNSRLRRAGTTERLGCVRADRRRAAPRPDRASRLALERAPPWSWRTT